MQDGVPVKVVHCLKDLLEVVETLVWWERGAIPLIILKHLKQVAIWEGGDILCVCACVCVTVTGSECAHVCNEEVEELETSSTASPFVVISLHLELTTTHTDMSSGW